MSLTALLMLTLAAALIGAGLTALLQGFTGRGQYDDNRPLAVILSALLFFAAGALIFAVFFFPQESREAAEPIAEDLKAALNRYLWEEEQPYVAGGALIMLLAALLIYRPRYWRARLQRWAERRGFKIISAEAVSDWSFWRGWAVWRRHKAAQFDVELEDQLGTRRKATVALGPAVGIHPNRVKLIWDDTYAPRRAPRQLSSKRFVPMDQE